MRTQISVEGLVATTPRHLVTQDGLPITSFRLASSERRFDRTENKWIDGETNWYTITSFNQLAINVAGSVSKGDRVMVSGNLRIRDWDNGERAGTSVEVEADTLGHDLNWGTGVFTRTVLVRDPDPIEPEPEEEEEVSAKVIVVEPEDLAMPPTSTTPAPEPEMVQTWSVEVSPLVYLNTPQPISSPSFSDWQKKAPALSLLRRGFRFLASNK